MMMSFTVLSGYCSAKIYKVGDSERWTAKDDVYYAWAERDYKEFHVGDSLVFEYDHNINDVTQVSGGLEYEFCDLSSPRAVYNTGHDIVTLTEPGFHYFITSNQEQCVLGQKLEVLVVQDPQVRFLHLQHPARSFPSESVQVNGVYEISGDLEFMTCDPTSPVACTRQGAILLGLSLAMVGPQQKAVTYPKFPKKVDFSAMERLNNCIKLRINVEEHLPDKEEEEKRIDTFFKLIKSYQEARKRRREELAEDVRKKTNVGETSGTVVVPTFQPEDFSQCSTDVKPLMAAVSDHKEGDVKVKEEEEEAKRRKKKKRRCFSASTIREHHRYCTISKPETPFLKPGSPLNISLWKNYFQQASGFVFVVDSIYRERIEDAKSFIYMVMDEPRSTKLETPRWTAKDDVYYAWAERDYKEFHVGDSLVFEYDHNINDVTHVSGALEYEFCDYSSPKAVYNTGHDVADSHGTRFSLLHHLKPSSVHIGTETRSSCRPRPLARFLHHHLARSFPRKNYKVGDSEGWKVYDSDFYNKWSEEKQFHVGDALLLNTLTKSTTPMKSTSRVLVKLGLNLSSGWTTTQSCCLPNFPKKVDLSAMERLNNCVVKTMKNEKDQYREREDEEEEEKRIDTFFKLIKSYQEARKRRREELAEDVRKKTNVGETSGTVVVPTFQPEDFSQCSTDVKPLMAAVSDHKEGDVKVKEEEEEAKRRKKKKRRVWILTLHCRVPCGRFTCLEYDHNINDVTQVSGGLEYEFCDLSSPRAVYNTGHDIATLTEPGFHYFITSNQEQCIGTEARSSRRTRPPSPVPPPPTPSKILPVGETYKVGDSEGWKVYDSDFYNKWKFMTCDPTSPVAVHKTGRDLVRLTELGVHYFITSNSGSCEAGLKLRAMVGPQQKAVTYPKFPKKVDFSAMERLNNWLKAFKPQH
ncbi:hypothetical protein Bca52824_062094 [Brassica carinata]|uniref:Phytocyanin domain-containing protein n=1 Tax=Brassica carinata TaxID=52824 RepID=A0A8X7U6Y8_BRACI|nr:hypothetical protein Bca52824_062094 [Brassica carinata]